MNSCVYLIADLFISQAMLAQSRATHHLWDSPAFQTQRRISVLRKKHVCAYRLNTFALHKQIQFSQDSCERVSVMQTCSLGPGLLPWLLITLSSSLTLHTAAKVILFNSKCGRLPTSPQIPLAIHAIPCDPSPKDVAVHGQHAWLTRPCCLRCQRSSHQVETLMPQGARN